MDDRSTGHVEQRGSKPQGWRKIAHLLEETAFLNDMSDSLISDTLGLVDVFERI